MLDDDAVREMRTRRAAGELVKDLAAAYGVPGQTASALVTGYRRLGAGGAISPPDSRDGPLKLTRVRLKLARQAVAGGATYGEVAAALGVSRATICKGLLGRTKGND